MDRDTRAIRAISSTLTGSAGAERSRWQTASRMRRRVSSADSARSRCSYFLVVIGSELGRAVADELASARPDWLRQVTFQLDDGLSFVTFSELDDPARLAGMPAFQRFRSTLDERCDESPVLTVLHEVGAYRFP